MKKYYSKIIGLGLLFLFFLFVIGPFHKDFFQIFIICIVLISVFVIFSLGVVISPKITKKNHFLLFPKRRLLICLTILSPICSLYATYFYTGSFFSHYINFLSGLESNYKSYYSYILTNNLNQFGIYKIPAILCNALVKISFFYSLHYYFFINNRKNILILLVPFISVLHFSIARGTSLELAESIVYISFCVLVYSKVRRKSLVKPVIGLFLFGILATIIFYFNLEFRNSNFDESYYLNSSLVFKYSNYNFVDEILYRINRYFSFGLLYIAAFFEFLYFDGIFVFIFPKINSLIVSGSFLCNYELNCSTMWTPSLTSIYVNFSMIGFLLFVLVLGLLSGILIGKSSLMESFSNYIIIYFNFYIVTSLFVDHLFNFSYNEIIYIICLIVSLIRFIKFN